MLRAEKIKQVESTKCQALQLAYQYLQQDFARKKKEFDVIHEKYHRHAAQREKLIGHLRMVNEDWRAQSHGRQLYINHLTKEIYKVIFTSWKMVKKVEALLQTYFPIRQDGRRIISFLEKAKDQYKKVKNFFSSNSHMINNV